MSEPERPNGRGGKGRGQGRKGPFLGVPTQVLNLRLPVELVRYAKSKGAAWLARLIAAEKQKEEGSDSGSANDPSDESPKT